MRRQAPKTEYRDRTPNRRNEDRGRDAKMVVHASEDDAAGYGRCVYKGGKQCPHCGRETEVLDCVGGEVGVGQEVSETLEDVAELKHPEGGEAEEGEGHAADGGGLGDGDTRFEEVQEGGGEEDLSSSQSSKEARYHISRNRTVTTVQV